MVGICGHEVHDMSGAVCESCEAQFSAWLADRETVGGRVKHQRKEARFSGELLAKKAKLSASMLWRIEHGKITPTISQLEAIAKVLKCDVELLKGGVYAVQHSQHSEASGTEQACE